MTVEHDERRHAFIARLPEGEAELAYHPMADGGIDVRHTFVPPAARGRGVGESLAGAAFDWARANGRRVVPTCPFVASWLAEHPDQGDIVAG